MSILFYSWANVEALLIIIISIIFNYFFGLIIKKIDQFPLKKKFTFTVAIIFNLLLLISFKYSNFLITNFLPGTIDLEFINFSKNYSIIGLSFFTFQTISYLADIYFKKIAPEKNFINFALYISFFPKLIAGPIVRYTDIKNDLSTRTITPDNFLNGINRFILGLGKKIIIGDTTGKIADNIFALTQGDLTTPLAWLGLVCFTLQIYFDFSGYSDMAIGLGKMFGFNLPENFNYPYISKSIKEFWQRWHISLSTWLKDYLYIPLGGNRKGKYRNYLNLMIVFALCGFWHGASWTFILWGVWYGLFSVIEKTPFGKFMESRNSIVKHLYTLLVIMFSWVLFKTTTVGESLAYFKALFGMANTTSDYYVEMYLNSETLTIIALGIISSTPAYEVLKNHLKKHQSPYLKTSLYLANIIFVSIIFLLSITAIATQTYTPFLYAQF